MPLQELLGAPSGPVLNLTPKSASGPPGLCDAVMRIAPSALLRLTSALAPGVLTTPCTGTTKFLTPFPAKTLRKVWIFFVEIAAVTSNNHRTRARRGEAADVAPALDDGLREVLDVMFRRLPDLRALAQARGSRAHPSIGAVAALSATRDGLDCTRAARRLAWRRAAAVRGASCCSCY